MLLEKRSWEPWKTAEDVDKHDDQVPSSGSGPSNIELARKLRTWMRFMEVAIKV